MFIAGNWKMNSELVTARQLARRVVEAIGDPGEVRVAVCPPFVSLQSVAEILAGKKISLGAQNMHSEDEGAFTGEVSAPMLRSVGCSFVILGHSERRQFFGETDENVNLKVRQALAHQLVPIICVGETLDERRSGNEQQVVETQLQGALADVTVDSAGSVVVAYEPVWAIGTGETASPDQAQEMHYFIRSILVELAGNDLARGIDILYGGSMKPDNARELLRQEDVDGGLIGGASLKGDAFAAIVRAAQESL